MTIMCIMIALCGFSADSLAELSNNYTIEDRLKHPTEPRIEGNATFNGPISYQVSIRLEIDSFIFGIDLIHTCTGSLVYPKYVVTAARCVAHDDDPFLFDKINYYVVFGTNSETDFSANSAIPVIAIKRLSHNGLGILQLAYPAPSEQIALIPMSSTGTHAGENCHLGGWRTSLVDTGTNHSDNRQITTTTVEIVDNDYCKKIYHTIGVEITSDMVCGGDKHKDVIFCNNLEFDGWLDGIGGPLVCNGELKGVISCGNKGYPGVYASVAYYKQWILDAIEECENTSATSVKPTQKPQPTNSPPESTTQPVSTSPTIGHQRPPVTTRPSSATKSTTYNLTYAFVLIVKLTVMHRI